MTKLEHALNYASMGWAVMPLHSIVDGHCDCNRAECASPGKHPRTMRGVKDATTNANAIRQWWGMWPDANIGVATGQQSGIVVLDVDDVAAGGLDDKDVPATVTQETGSGGIHYIYRHPGDRRVKSSVRIVPGVDSRADGGYIVVPPSNHIRGHYRWTLPPEITEIAPAPEWWLSALEETKARTDVPRDGEPIFAGGRNQTLASLAGSMRRSGMGYEAILAALLAHNQAVCVPPMADEEVTGIARSISGYMIETPEEQELREHGSMVAARLLKTNEDAIARSLALDRRQIETAGPPPANFMPPHGLIRDIADYILSASHRPQPILATMAAIAVVAALAGRRYATETDLRTNVYMVGIAQSGYGKEAGRKAIKKILTQIPDGLAILGGEDIKSGAALVSALEEHPTKLYLLDEFGDKLQAMTNSRTAASHQREIVEKMKVFYSSAGNVFTGADYADRKSRKQTVIYDPCLVLYGTTTPGAFYAALSSAEGTGGALARMMVVEIEARRPAAQRDINIEQPPATLINALKEMRALGLSGNLVDSTGAVDTSRPTVVRMTNMVKDAWYALDDALEDKMVSDVAASVYNRVAENAAKLALIYAVAKDPHAPLIDEEAFTWARDIALWSANLIMEKINLHVADTEAERTAKEIEAAVIAGGAQGKTKSELNRVLTKIRPYEQQGYLSSLVDNGILFMGKRATGGRPATVYIAAQFYSEAKRAGVVDADENAGE